MTKPSPQKQIDLRYNEAWQEELALVRKYKEDMQMRNREQSAQAALRRLTAVRDGKLKAEA